MNFLPGFSPDFSFLTLFFPFLLTRLTMNTDKLHKLIHSMSGVEKRHFQQSIRGGKEAKSVQLFLAILKQKEYKEAPLVKKFDYSKNPNGFAVAKNHLSKLVLKTLREASPSSSDYQKLLEQLKNVEILEKRGLRDEALKALQKLQEIATKNQWGAFLLVGEKWKFRLSTVSSIPQLSASGKGEHIDVELQYNIFYRRLVKDNLIYGFNQRLNDTHCYREIITHPLMQRIEETPNLLCQWYFCLVKVELSKSENNIEKRLFWAEKLIAVKYKMGSHGYVEYDWRSTSHFEYLNALIYSRNFSKFQEEYPKMLNYEIPAHRLDLIKHRKRDALLLRLHAFVFEKYSPSIFDDLMQQVELYVKSKNFKKVHTNDMSLMLTIIYLYYSVGQYGKVLEWNAFCDKSVDRDLYVDNHIMKEVLVILSHQQLNNFAHIKSLLPALERHIEKHNRLIPVHVFLLRYIKKIQQPMLKKEKNALLRDFKADMKALIKGGSSGYLLQPEGLLIWAESQLANIPLLEMNQMILEERLKL